MIWITKVFLFCRLFLKKKKIQERKTFPKKRRQLLEQKVLRKKLKICNLELHNDGVKVAIEDPVDESWLGFLNVLQIIVRSLVNFDCRMKFANAITFWL